jgi:tRNA (cmo5U34)-methyltransferase
MKSTIDEIRACFDNDVDRFSTLETGQVSIMDAPLLLDLVARAAVATNPQATHLCDIGCGAGNYTLKLLQLLPGCSVTLVDLSRPMVDRAAERVREATVGAIVTKQGDIREVKLEIGTFDIIVAAAVLHHLRDDAEWEAVFAKCYSAVRGGGSFWIADLVEHATPAIHGLMWKRYGEYLEQVRSVPYRDAVFACIEEEDTPRSLGFQLDLLRRVGFSSVEVLHKNGCFAAFGGIK